jgi:ferredoxin
VRVTVRLDKRSCQSSGRCARSEPDGFRLDDDHLGEARPGAGELPLERLRAVARACPALAITLEDETGREIEL